MSPLPLRMSWTLVALAAALLAVAPAPQARVTKIVIDKKVSPAFPLKEGGFQSFGAAGPYEHAPAGTRADER